MRKTFLLFTALASYCTCLFASFPDKEKFAEILDERSEYILSNIGLTQDELEAFAPVYKEYQLKRMELYGGHRLNRCTQPEQQEAYFEELSEDECQTLNERYMQNKVKRAELDFSFYQKFKTMISEKKIFKLYSLEKKYKKELLKQVKEKR